MPPTADIHVSIPAHVTWTTSNGEVLLIDQRSEAICGLDHVAAAAFIRLAAHQSLATVIDELLAIYAVDQEVIRRDLTALVDSLEESGLVAVSRSAS